MRVEPNEHRFEPLPDELDFPAMERRILDFWERNRCFETLREKNANGPRWSFFDGPITANNPMGVHHAWGRTYKDVYQRYRAMRGYHQRFQNGFDCQGLWLEVEVEKELGFESKRDIEEYGLEEFADRCRERVGKYSAIQTEQSVRLGQWMDWPSSYFTHHDSNVEHIWHFLKTCHQRGWIEQSQRAMPWCSRCGTALSQHELVDTYEQVTHDSVYVRFPLCDQPAASLLIWTTTPWTLAANVAAAVHPELEYVEVERAGHRYYMAAAALAAGLAGESREIRRLRGSEMLGWRYVGPFDELPAVRGTEHRVIPWSEVGAEEGTGIVHIAPGAGEEDFQLSRELDLPVLIPIDENGLYVDGYAFLTGRDASEVAASIIADLRARKLLERAERFEHRYPHCWRCREELVFRVDAEWFIRVDGIRGPMLEAAAEVRWIPEYAGAQMANWLQNMGDWNISRRRFWGLPLPFYPCAECGRLNVIGSRAELESRALSGLEQLRELHRPWIDRVTVSCEQCGEPVRRITAVGDAWLDAGIVPFSTLGYLGRGSAWSAWYPADFITEMREQIRLWFYSMLFMSVTLEGRSPYQTVFVYEKLNDETGRPMHKSWGNAVEFHEAAERMGADVMRWMYAGQNPLYNINFGYGPAGEIKRRLLTLWNTYAFFITYARLDRFDPGSSAIPVAARSDLDRWAISRLQGLIETMTKALDAYSVHLGVRAAQAFIDDLSNWYVRRGRRRYWKAEDDTDKQAAYQTLHEALTVLVRLLAPIMPFWAEDIYQNLARSTNGAAPPSVHLSEWPQADPALRDVELDAAMAKVQRVVRVGRAARSSADLKLRQPLRTALVGLADESAWDLVHAHSHHVLEELNVKSIEPMPKGDELVEYVVKLNYRALGPRLGRLVKPLAARLSELDPGSVVRTIEDGGSVHVEVDGRTLELSGDDILIRRTARAGYGVAEQDGIIVAVSTELDDDLRAEGLAREVVHAVQNLRKTAGLEISDRIVLWLNGDDRVSQMRSEHGDMISAEVLALDLRGDPPPAQAEAAAARLNGVQVNYGLQRLAS